MDTIPNLAHATEQKRRAAQKAVASLTPGLHLALGTGSTANIFILELVKSPLVNTFTLYSTSRYSSELATNYNLKVTELSDCHHLDLTVDGADAVDEYLNLIKGFGGALTREKIAAKLAKEVWILIDASKRCISLPLNRIPCEIVPSSLSLVRLQLENHKMQAALRIGPQEEIFVTDNGNWILDIDATECELEIHLLASFLKSLTGVLEHGLFLKMPVKLFDGS